MSTKSTVAHADTFHIYDELMSGGTYLELDTSDFAVSFEDFQQQPRLRVRLPKELLDRLQLDGKQMVEAPAWTVEKDD